MKKLNVSADPSSYPNIAGETVLSARLKLGSSKLTISCRTVPGGLMPVLVVDFFSERGRLYSVRHHLPVDTPGRTARRVSLLMRLIEKTAGQKEKAMIA